MTVVSAPIDAKSVKSELATLIVRLDEGTLRADLSSKPADILKKEVPTVIAKLSNEQVETLAQLVLAAPPVDTGVEKGFVFCPACRPGLYALLAAAGLAGVVAGAATAGAAAEAFIAAVVPVVVAASGLGAAEATLLVQGVISAVASGNLQKFLATIDKMLCDIAELTCQRMGC